LSPFRRKTRKNTSDEERGVFASPLFSFGGSSYPISQTAASWSEGEPIANDFTAYVHHAYQSVGPVFSCVLARQLILSEARFAFRRFEHGQPGELFGTSALSILEQPWPNGTTGELLARMEQDASLAGNCYLVRRGDRIQRLRPDWVTIVAGSSSDADVADLDVNVLGYLLHPRGDRSAVPLVFTVDEVAHYSPIPDPLAAFRGMSWLTPVLREIQADTAATVHKWKFFENGATPNIVLSSDQTLNQEQAEVMKQRFDTRVGGIDGAYSTVVLGSGVNLQPVGHSFEQMNFKATQGAGETRIAAAAGVPPVIAGFSEGLESATYSNYAQARRRFADGTIRPLWRMAAASLAKLVDVPTGAQLWYDDSDIAFLREDTKDAAEIRNTQALAVQTLISSGFDPDAVIAAVTAGDFSRLAGAHVTSQPQPLGDHKAPIA